VRPIPAANPGRDARVTERFRRRAILGLIILGYLSLAVLYAVHVPIWNAPDEPAHYNFIRTIAVDHRLPVLVPGDYDQAEIARLTSDHFRPGESIDGLRYESHQPPLYYLLEAPIFLATARASRPVQVVALRLVTALIGALVILATYRLASLVFPKPASYPLAAAAFVAFLPMHLFMDAAIDNDALVELLLCLVLIVLVDDLIKPREPRNDLLVGVAAGLAALTKLDGGISAVLIVVGFAGSALLAADRARALRRVPLRVIRAGLVALLISGWWFVRNVVIYGLGDPFALRRHAQVVLGQPLTGALTRSRLRDLALTAFHSFWGQFGWMGIPYTDRTYDVLATLSLLVALGVALYAWRVIQALGPGVRLDHGANGDAVEPRQDREKGALPTRRFSRSFAPFRDVRCPDAPRATRGPNGPRRSVSPRPPIPTSALALLLLEILLVVVGVVFYNLRYLQPQGRYFFPALPALAILSVAGIGELIRDEHVGLVLTIAGIALFWFCAFSLFQVIGPAFATALARRSRRSRMTGGYHGITGRAASALRRQRWCASRSRALLLRSLRQVWRKDPDSGRSALGPGTVVRWRRPGEQL